MRNRRYSFNSVWDIDQLPEKVWHALTATPFSWSDWWPQLTNLHNIQAVSGLSGTSFSCTWKAPIGYGLDCDIKFGEVVDLHKVVLYADGDLRGTVTCIIVANDAKTHVDINWQVETTRAWMNYLHPILKPFFIWSHHAVMRSGERGLHRYLRQQTTT